MSITLQVVTPHGIAWSAHRLGSVVLRRREERFEMGSEIVVLPRHSEMMVRLPRFALRARGGGTETTIEVDGGFAEVYHDTITVLTPEARVLPAPQAACVPTDT